MPDMYYTDGMSTPDAVSNTTNHSALQASQDYFVERFIVDKICQPIVNRLPRQLSPNTISLANSILCWLLVLLAAVAPGQTPSMTLTLRILAAFGLFGSMLLDCIDGMHARNTNQCSKLGEVLDHGLDAANTPLFGALVAVILELDPALTAVAIFGPILVYNAQLVYYHHTGDFVLPQLSGVGAQFSSCLTIIGFALLFFWAGRDTYWVNLIVICFVWSIAVLSLYCVMWYVLRIKWLALDHAKMLFLSSGCIFIYVNGTFDTFYFVALGCCLSFRINGRYVLTSVLGERYDGWDWGAFLWIAAIGLATFATEPISLDLGITLNHLLTIGACLWLIGPNLLDTYRNYARLKPTA